MKPLRTGSLSSSQEWKDQITATPPAVLVVVAKAAVAEIMAVAEVVVIHGLPGAMVETVAVVMEAAAMEKMVAAAEEGEDDLTKK